MLPIIIENADHIMKAPASMPDCFDLHVRVIDHCYVSRWEPTPAELATLNAGGSVELWCVGSQPPVGISVAPHV